MCVCASYVFMLAGQAQRYAFSQGKYTSKSVSVAWELFGRREGCATKPYSWHRGSAFYPHSFSPSVSICVAPSVYYPPHPTFSLCFENIWTYDSCGRSYPGRAISLGSGVPLCRAQYHPVPHLPDRPSEQRKHYIYIYIYICVCVCLNTVYVVWRACMNGTGQCNMGRLVSYIFHVVVT